MLLKPTPQTHLKNNSVFNPFEVQFHELPDHSCLDKKIVLLIKRFLVVLNDCHSDNMYSLKEHFLLKN